MSYDLYFKSRAGSAIPSVEEIAAYFRTRRNFEANANQALYKNETTGVYFIFNLGDEEDTAESSQLPIAFNLNYFRPHIFGLEAEPEVRAFVQKFNLLVFDPQTHGMGEGEYSSEGFLRGWNTGNEFGYKAILQQNPNQQIFSLPTSRIESCWRWNLDRDALQNNLGESVFVPRFMFFNVNGKAASAVVWPDGLPGALPDSDYFVIPRTTILPKRFLRPAQEDMVFASQSQIAGILSGFPLVDGPVPYRLLKYSDVPAAVATHLRGLSPTNEKLNGLAVDSILNAELVEKIKSDPK